MKKAETGNTVKVHYTGRLDDGTVFDSSKDRDPLVFTIGQKQMIPGFENSVMDMGEGENKTVSIPAVEAYGEYRDDMVFDFPRDKVPADMELLVGGSISLKADNDQIVPVIIKEVSDETIRLDANHLLAGKDLTFDLEVVEIS